MHYALTSIRPTICCYGSSFPTLASAKNYAFELQEAYGLCQVFNIGCYEPDGYRIVYKSNDANVATKD